MKIQLFQPISIFELGQRSNQEDSISQWDGRLFVLCDGMGGHERGEVASQTVCQALVTWFSSNIVPNNPFSDEQLRDALSFAYDALDKHDDGSPKKMGTTLTLLYIHSQGVTAAHIGDSRIYHIRPFSVGEPERAILYQSRDHSLVFDLFQSGEITFEEMATYPQKNIITRAMQPGADNHVRPDIIHITDIQPGDYFYMCSDGMLEQMTNDELATLFSSDTTDEEKRKRLLEATANNQDNHSAWLIRVKDVIHEEGDNLSDNEESTARCNAINILRERQEEESNVVEMSMSPAIDDDVVIVSTPDQKKQASSRKTLPKTILALLISCTILLFVLCLLFMRQCGSPKELQNKAPVNNSQSNQRETERKTEKYNRYLRIGREGHHQQYQEIEREDPEKDNITEDDDH